MRLVILNVGACEYGYFISGERSSILAIESQCQSLTHTDGDHVAPAGHRKSRPSGLSAGKRLLTGHPGHSGFGLPSGQMHRHPAPTVPGRSVWRGFAQTRPARPRPHIPYRRLFFPLIHARCGHLPYVQGCPPADRDPERILQLFSLPCAVPDQQIHPSSLLAHQFLAQQGRLRHESR